MTATRTASGNAKAPRRPEIAENIEKQIRPLMTVQRQHETGYDTEYRGSEAEFLKAGLPRSVLQQPMSKKPFAFRAAGRDASIVRDKDGYLLTLHWDQRGPWYWSAEHPALSEIARMIRIDVGYWLRGRSRYDLEERARGIVPTNELLDCERAVDYRLPRSKRFRFDADELAQIEALLQHLATTIQKSSIFQIVPLRGPKPPRKRRPSPEQRAKLAEAAKADPQVRDLLASAVGKATKRLQARKSSTG